MTNLVHLVQDLRANAYRCPADVAPLLRQAAAALERAGLRATVRSDLDALLDSEVLPPPFPPPRLVPEIQQRDARVKGAPVA